MKKERECRELAVCNKQACDDSILGRIVPHTTTTEPMTTSSTKHDDDHFDKHDDTGTNGDNARRHQNQ
jgi:hypothetical protein